MKNYAKAAGILCLAIMGAGAAQAEIIDNGNWYAGISGDLTWLDHSGTGGGVNLDLGYRIMPDIRLEGEAGYHNVPGDSGYTDTHYFTYMGNAYYDFNKFTFTPTGTLRIVPYLGAGLGVAEASFGNSTVANTFHHHDTDFAYQGMAGITLACSSMPNIDWSLGYRYLGETDNDVSANNVELALRYHF